MRNIESEYRRQRTEEIISIIEKGTLPWKHLWKDSLGLPHNVNSKKTYCGLSTMIIEQASKQYGYKDPRWCTEKQATARGWKIKEGEEGINLEYWKKYIRQTDNGKNKNFQQLFVKQFCIYNVEQMTGVPPLQKNEHTWEPEAEAEKILKNSGAVIRHDTTNMPFYVKGDDVINFPEKSQFNKSGDYYLTAFHELAHWTGHSSRLNRKIIKNDKDHSREELRAELASCFIADKLGIQYCPENNAAYIESWVKILRSDKNEIFRAAADADKIADFILEFQNEKHIEQKQVETPAQKNIAKTDIRLMVDIKEKNEAKALGARWDKELKTWYAPKGENLDKLAVFMGDKVVNLRDTQIFVNFDDRAEAKKLGAWWNGENKSWYIPAGSDIKNLPSQFFDASNKNIQQEEKQTFAEFAKKNGLILDSEPAADGKIHRVPVEDGKPNSKDGAYVFFDDASGKAGWIKNFKTGFESSYGENKEQGAEIKRVSAEELAARKQELDAKHNEMAKTAWYLCNKVFTKAPDDHPYLQAKGIKPHDALVDKDGTLIIPLKNAEGKIRTFQRIAGDGTKGFLKGAEQQGTSYWFGSPKDKVIICEGFSTGASIYESTRIPTISAMQSGNLPAIAQQVRDKYGEKMNIVVAADNDHAIEPKIGYNPGIKFATEAANKVNGTLVVPQLNEHEKAEKFTDFNDIMKSRGTAEVKAQIFSGAKELKVKSRECER